MGLALRQTLPLDPAQAANDARYITVRGRRVCDAGIKLIETFEGVRLEAYHDAVGFPTQGVGHLLSRERGANLSQWPAITLDDATVWLEQDLYKVNLGILRLFPIPLDDDEYAALASFGFNLGLGALEASTLRRQLLRNNRLAAAEEFLKWNHAGGRILAGLTRRRAAERALFLHL